MIDLRNLLNEVNEIGVPNEELVKLSPMILKSLIDLVDLIEKEVPDDIYSELYKPILDEIKEYGLISVDCAIRK